MESVSHLRLVNVPTLERRRGPEPVLVLRQHVGCVDVRPAVVVDVRDVQPHREVGEIGHLLVELFVERPVVVVDVQIVALEEIVRDIDVRPPVAIYVAHHHSKTERDLAAEDAGLLAHVREMAVAIVVEQLVAAELVANIADVPEPEAADRAEGVVDEEHVQIPVAVVVEEGRLGRVPFVREPVLARHLLEGRNAILVQPLVDVQLVRAALARDVAGVADVDVEQPVAVHVGEGDSGGPESLAADPRFIGHVLELEVALVQVELVPVLVGGEHDLGKSISIEVADRHATAVVEIAVGEDVQLRRGFDAVFEVHPGIAGGKQRE